MVLKYRKGRWVETTGRHLNPIKSITIDLKHSKTSEKSFAVERDFRTVSQRYCTSATSSGRRQMFHLKLFIRLIYHSARTWDWWGKLSFWTTARWKLAVSTRKLSGDEVGGEEASAQCFKLKAKVLQNFRITREVIQHRPCCRLHTIIYPGNVIRTSDFPLRFMHGRKYFPSFKLLDAW